MNFFRVLRSVFKAPPLGVSIRMIGTLFLLLPWLAAAQNPIRVQAQAIPANGGPAPLAVSFSANGSPPSAPNSSVATYTWNFDDGVTAKGRNASRTYSKPGRYRATVIYTRFINRIDPPELIEKATNTVIIVVTAPATLQIVPNSFTLIGQESGASPNPQSVTVSNAGGSSLRWSVSHDAPTWLSLSVVSGSLVAGQATQLQAFVTNSRLQAGTYQARITFTSREAGNSPVVRTAKFVMRPMSSVLLPEPAIPPPNPNATWWKWILWTVVALVGLAVAVALLHKPSPSPPRSAAIKIKPIMDRGKQKVKTTGSLLAAGLTIDVKWDAGTIALRATKDLIGKVTKTKG